MIQIVNEIIGIATVSITVFGVIFCLLQREFFSVYRSFALFLIAVSIANSPDAFFRVLEATLGDDAKTADLLIWLSSSLFLAPLFWTYIVTLTSAEQRKPSRHYLHFALPAFAVLTSILIIVSPPDVAQALTSDGVFPASGVSQAIVLMAIILLVAPYLQMAIYLFLIVRRMIHYRLVLRDVHASTEEHEMRWVYVIAGLGVFYWGSGALSFIIAVNPEQQTVPGELLTSGGLFSLMLVTAMTLWGLRQRPHLVPQFQVPDNADTIVGVISKQTGDKYEKSALSAEASSRIAQKLRASMERDHLHRDPNLSLWTLARHIGASPNYISQTLNEMIGESFFDFVNGYRVQDAMKRLSTTNDTVLTVTYDVGFNARSSFYNAFKRVTGQTPTAFRKKLSLPEGLDDQRA